MHHHDPLDRMILSAKRLPMIYQLSPKTKSSLNTTHSCFGEFPLGSRKCSLSRCSYKENYFSSGK